MVAAYMVLCDHVKNDLSCIEGTETLLTPEVSKFIECNDANKDHIGAYLYRDNNHGVVIRSGKVSAQGFVQQILPFISNKRMHSSTIKFEARCV